MADPNRAQFEGAVQLLAPVLDVLVFVGGCTTGLFITDAMAAGIRPTQDVDAIVDVATYAQYARLSGQLRSLGLVEDDSPGAPMCRWRRDELLIDVMPTREDVLGFSNRWYALAIETAETRTVAGLQVRVVTPALFVATKLDAFRGRGDGDMVTSHDLEDIVMVVDGRPELVDEIAAAAPEVRDYIAATLGALIASRDFLEALPVFLLPDAASQARRSLVERRLRALAEL